MVDREIPLPAEQAFGLTERQTLFWVERKLARDVPLHNTALTVELTGVLDVPRLEAAYREMVSRLDFLRLFVDDAEPRAWIVDQPAPPLEHVDLSDDPGRYESWKAERSLRPFEFPGWLFSPVLVRLGPDKHVFYLLLHHIGSDGTSAMRLVDYLAELYEGHEPAPRASFRDYVTFEAAYRGSPKHARDATYWAGKLGAGVPPLRFYGETRTDRSVAIDRVWHDSGAERRRRFDELVGSEQFRLLTPAMSRLGGLATLLFAFLHRVTENRELVIATPLENRTARFEDSFGLLMEQTFLKVTIEEGETFASLAEKVRTDLVRTFRHGQHAVSERGLDFVSLNLLIPRTGMFGNLGCKVLLQAAPTLGGPLDGMEGGLRNTLGIQIHESQSVDSFVVGFDLHAKTFSGTKRERVIAHFERMLDALLADPSQRIDSVDLAGDAEREVVLRHARGSEPGAAVPDVVDRFAEQVARRSDVVAVIAPGDRLTYAELAARVNRLARRLIELGVGPEARVAVSLPRGADEISTLLAVLTAGGAYVPLDPAQPPDRLRLILEDAAPEVLVTRHDMPLASAAGPFRRVYIEDETAGLQNLEPTRPPVSVDPSQLAYILFTSGSTGRPKGVEIPRGAFSNFLGSMAHTPGLSEDEHLLAITTTMFDIAGLELFLPLWVGATVQIADRETAADPRRLRAILEREPIDVLQATPATWRMLVETGWRGTPSLRMFCGGEALSRELCAELLARGKELYNLYGPTETTVWSTLAKMDRDAEIDIGRPIDRTQIYVLDAGGHVSPIGVAGELCIAGAGLARGYHGRPDLTTERFVPNPYGPPGDRIYRTGDLARLREDGRFECLGRLDHQVKIRGFRIELGEIESVLRQVNDVNEIVVVARPGQGGDPRLVAYYTGSAGREALVDRARKALPHYMHPSALVRLEAFPLNANGKIDRKALPEPAEDETDGRERVAPRNAMERELCAIWQRALGAGEVGVSDDFFELGGHSLLAVKIFDDIHKLFGIELPLAVLFEAPTVEALAARLGALQTARAEDASDWSTIVPLQSQGFLPPLFCVAGLGGNPMNLMHLAKALGEDQPFYGLQHRGVDGKRAPFRRVPDMAEEFLNHVRRAQPKGPYYLAGYSAGGLAAYEMACILEALEERVALLILFDTFNPTAPRWSTAERIQAHVDKLRERGPSYIGNRVLDRFQRGVDITRRVVGAKLARHAPFRFRHEALVEAGIEAERVYRPQPYSGHVLLLQADARLTAGDGIGYRPHESNGWRGYINGRLDVVQIACSHTDVVSEKASPLAAAEVRRALAQARQRYEPGVRTNADELPPRSSRRVMAL